ncbi:MAG: ferredoxin--NADP reductase [Betaproteobacteria bacterium]|nr:ferredoxin--NADP reductase [Betaproteobacteria bacterium]
MTEKNWIAGEVVALKRWAERLYSIDIGADYPPFQAGQFARLGLYDAAGELVERPYSLVNSPGTQPLEFYFIALPQGVLTPRLAQLRPGEAVYLAPRPSGLFTLAAVPAGESLWCLATGTGIGPFLSILGTEEPWARFAKVVLVHAVREATELTYGERIAGFSRVHPGRFVYLPMVSRERSPGALAGRIPQAIDDGRLEQGAGATLVPAQAQVMLCGNPEMLRDTTLALEGRGLKRNRKKAPGQITVESYW